MRLFFKRIGLFILLLLVSNSLSSQNLSFDLSDFLHQQDSIIQSKIGTPFLDFSATSVNGKIISEKQLQGKVTIINFWFAGCTPCISEFDRLNALYEKFKDNDRFQFLSFTFDSYDSIIQTKLKYDLPYEICSIPREDCQRLATNTGFPTTIIVDQLGIINFINTGGHTDKDKVLETINEFEQVITNLLELSP